MDNSNTRFEHTTIEWPVWPLSSPTIEQAVTRVLRSGRWAISSMNAGHESEERRFGRAFADYIGLRFGVPTANGSSALVAALEAAGVGFGDEVLVPGLVWVACASAVARVGAIPVFVDIDETDYAMRPDAADDLVTERTAAILLVHLSSSVADLDAFTDVASRHGVPLIEDCSQAHGAVWRGRRVGSFGLLAAFSFQSSKLLTAGEGGIVVTDDADLFGQVQQLRADGRQWLDGPARRGFPDLRPGSGRQGHNHCMTEMQAAILISSLPLLDQQNRTRIRAVRHLEERFAEVEGVRTVRRRDDARVDLQTFWHLPVQIDRDSFGGVDTETVRAAVSDGVGLYLEPVGAPLYDNPLYLPSLYCRFPAEHVRRLSMRVDDLPGARQLSTTCFTIPHHALLADERSLDALVETVIAVQQRLQSSRSSR